MTYAVCVFDCDGVLLDSNAVKAEALAQSVASYGPKAEAEMRQFHSQNGGLSRYHKLDHFFSKVLGRQDDYQSDLQRAVDDFGRYALEAMRSCSLTTGVCEFLAALPKATPKYVISGGDQDEVREILTYKGLSTYFNQIYGSPATKADHLTQLRKEGKLSSPGLYVGDSQLDYEVAGAFGLEFVFMSAYTQMPDWERFFAHKTVSVVDNLQQLGQKMQLG